MGCDIHTCLEVYNQTTKEWESSEIYKKNEYSKEVGEPEFVKVDVYDDRNYQIFAALCNVRNYGESPYIWKPRGVPFNASNDTKKDIRRWEGDGHSHNWNTLAELYSFQENHPHVKRSGLISQKQSEDLDRGILPNSWCRGSSDKTKVRREWEEEADVLLPLIDAIERQLRNTAYIFQPKKSANEIRIVYWFDN